jgi:hypothetical protein
MAEEKVTTEEEATTEGKIYEVDSGKLVKLHGLLAECISLARETLEDEFGDLASVQFVGGSLGKLTCDLAIALFNKASTPDQTETMLVALEKGLEWFDAREEKQKAESAQISAEFQKSISAVLPKPPRMATALEILVRNLIDFTSRFAEVELTKLSDEAEEPIQTFTQEKGSPTPEE